MIADLGIILPRQVRIRILSELPRETRSWGDENFIVGDIYHCYPNLENVLLQVFKLGKFIARLLPPAWHNLDLEYVGIGGVGKSDYLNWLDFECGPEIEHIFEKGLESLLSDAGSCAFVLVPDDETVEEVGSVSASALPKILRRHLQNDCRSPGFFAIVSDSQLAN